MNTNTFVNAAVDTATTTTTENGDKTFNTSLNACVDLFFQGGAMRTADWKRIQNLFSHAFAEDSEVAARVALYLRDIRGGAGERKFFRTVLQYLEAYEPDYLVRILPLVPVVGRWDDLFSVMNTDRSSNAVLSLFCEALVKGNALAAKWAPREKQNPVLAARIRGFMQLPAKEYRKLVAAASKTVEQQMCANDWENIVYSHVPSVASSRYANAFRRHDSAGYAAYLDAVRNNKVDDKTGKIAKINTGAVFPYDVVNANVDDDVTADTMWNKLPDYVPEGLSFMPIVDVSGSMAAAASGANVTCMDIATSLGLYLAERNKSAFKDLFITFSTNPKFQRIQGGSIRAKLRSMNSNDWHMSTDLDKAMALILDTAVKNRVPQSDMPAFLLIMSDMEFNGGYGGRSSVTERTKQAFEAAGYKLPNIVWWNIQSRNGSTPVRYDATGMALVSGASPSIVKSLLGGEVSPVAIMKRAVMVDKYNH